MAGGGAHAFNRCCVNLSAAALAAGCAATVSADAYGPDLVTVSPGVQVIADYDEPIFYSDGFYWRYDGGGWYRSTYYTGGWVYARPPVAVLRIDRPYALRALSPRGLGRPSADRLRRRAARGSRRRRRRGWRGTAAGGYRGAPAARRPRRAGAAYRAPQPPARAAPRRLAPCDRGAARRAPRQVATVAGLARQALTTVSAAARDVSGRSR